MLIGKHVYGGQGCEPGWLGQSVVVWAGRKGAVNELQGCDG